MLYGRRKHATAAIVLWTLAKYTEYTQKNIPVQSFMLKFPALKPPQMLILWHPELSIAANLLLFHHTVF